MTSVPIVCRIFALCTSCYTLIVIKILYLITILTAFNCCFHARHRNVHRKKILAFYAMLAQRVGTGFILSLFSLFAMILSVSYSLSQLLREQIISHITP